MSCAEDLKCVFEPQNWNTHLINTHSEKKHGDMGHLFCRINWTKLGCEVKEESGGYRAMNEKSPVQPLPRGGQPGGKGGRPGGQPGGPARRLNSYSICTS